MLITQSTPTDLLEKKKRKRRRKEKDANGKIDKEHKQIIHRNPMTNKQMKRCPASPKINEKQMNAIIRYFSAIALGKRLVIFAHGKRVRKPVVRVYIGTTHSESI